MYLKRLFKMETDFSKTRYLKDVDKAFLNKVKTIYYFGERAFMITEDDDCFGIGNNEFGMLGIGSDQPEQVFTPQRVTSLCQKRIKNFSCGRVHAVGLTEHGKLYTWGRNNDGRLGLGHKDDIYSPVMVQGCLSGKHIIQAACGSFHTLVLTSNGEIFATGDNSCGILGIESTINQSLFVQITNGIGTLKIIQISCGSTHSAAVSITGEIFMWGRNDYGQIGTGNKNDQLTPCKLNLPNPIKKVALGSFHTLALTENGILYAWGFNKYGQLGIKNDTECLKEPIRTCEDLGLIIDIFANGDFCCCKTDTSVYVWGKCNEKKQMSPRISPFTDFMQAALDAKVYWNYHPIIIAMKCRLMDILGISIVCSDNTTVDEESINTDTLTAWKSHFELRAVSSLGCGSFGNVWKVQHNLTKHMYAVKRISLAHALQKRRELPQVLREVAIQEQIKHENVVEFRTCWLENTVKEIKLEEVQVEDSGSSTSPNDSCFLFIQMELCDGDLTRLFAAKNLHAVAQSEINMLFKQLVTGLDKIHQMNFIHRDLKPANIFYKKVQNRLIWKIGDFGLAFQTTGRASEVQSVVGTYSYRSPEMLKGRQYTNKTDIYSLGLIFFETLMKIQKINDVQSVLIDIPFEVHSERIIQQYLSQVTYYNQFQVLILQMLKPNPEHRPSTTQLLDYFP